MIYLHHSTYKETGDCLGGHLSAVRCKEVYPRIISDTMDCLIIRNMHLNFYSPQYIEIVKVLDAFVVYYYDGINPRVTLYSDPINTGESVEILVGTGSFYLTLERVKPGAPAGRMRVEFPLVRNAPWARPNLEFDDLTPYYALIYMVLTEATYINTITGTDHYFVSTTASTYQAPIADHLTAPGGATWAETTTIDDTLDPGAYPIWLKNMFVNSPVLAIDATEDLGFGVGVAFSSSTMSTTKKYAVYGAYDGSVTDGILLASSDTLPIAVPLTPPGAGTRTYRMRLIEQTPYGISSQNVYLDQVITIDSTGADVTKPDPPDSITITALDGGRAQIDVVVTQPSMGAKIAAIIVTVDGTETEIDVTKSGTYSTITDQIDWGDPITAYAHVIDTAFNESAQISDTITMYYDVGLSPDYLTAHNSAGVSSIGYQDSAITLIDGTAVLFGEAGQETTLTLDDVVAATIGSAGIVLAADYYLINGAVGGASTDYLEDAGGGIYYLGDGTTRQVKIDTGNKQITAAAFKQPLDPQCPLPGPVEVTGGLVRFQYVEHRYNTFIMLDGSDCYHIDIIQSES